MDANGAARNKKRRRAVFDAVHEVLKREEQDWARSLAGIAAEDCLRDRFYYAWGVRCASEVAIGYLATKLLVTEGRLGRDFVQPERSCGDGRMDLWIGDTAAADGLGIEFKCVASNKEANTVPPQAARLRGDTKVESAGFVLWEHGIGHGLTMDTAQLFAEPEPTLGWTTWNMEARESFPAFFRGPKTLTVWLFGSDRVVSPPTMK